MYSARYSRNRNTKIGYKLASPMNFSGADIIHEHISQRIFLSFDGVTCFACEQSGHIAKNCTNANQSNINILERNHIGTPNQQIINKIMDITLPISTPHSTDGVSTEMTRDGIQYEEQYHNSKSCKRPSSTTTAATPNTPEEITHRVDFIRTRKHKKN
ncbi:hypothetical protein WA026_016161 [Henosepilachna vigintioctopunctata]|uniref:CCHC-type domain-containing protein n=1 Tax=Henosepilachna vigintioctopunctata TaxID=420089 RepID=A0AAW1TU33_9CUCU